MSGGIQAYEKVISEKRCQLIAMQVFGAGSIPPVEALEYVCNLNGVNSILFGASSQKNICQSKQLIDSLSKPSVLSKVAS